MKKYMINQQTLKLQYLESARNLFGKELKDLNPFELNAVIANVVKNEVISSNYEDSKNLYSEKRIAVYFSIEFLIGRIVLDMLNNVGLLKVTNEIFAQEGIDINCLEEVPDVATGNGGLGRLAACFIESAATKGYPLYGAGLYYKYGLFKQEFDNAGNQIEKPDDWTANGEAWFDALEDESVIVEFQDTKVKAVPYVMPIVGYNSSEECINSNVYPLTLWKAEPIPGVTNESAAKISDWLYPNDSQDDGKKLRLRQEYLFTSATIQRIFNIHLKKHGTLDNIEDYYFFQMNDTHPVMACLEFVRLLKLNGYTPKEAFEKAKKCFAYTNHTIMTVALEKWPIIIFKDILPNLFKVIEDLNQILIDELIGKDEFCNITFENGRVRKDPDWGKVRKYELFADGCIHMARIACFVGNKINGVAAVHTEIIKNDTLDIWYKLCPEKFNNKTNGVTPRRWIKLANPGLSEFLDKYVGKDWITNLSRLELLEQYKNNPEVLAEFATVKNTAKNTLIECVL